MSEEKMFADIKVKHPFFKDTPKQILKYLKKETIWVEKEDTDKDDDNDEDTWFLTSDFNGGVVMLNRVPESALKFYYI